MKAVFKTLVLVVAAGPLLLFFQNCGQPGSVTTKPVDAGASDTTAPAPVVDAPPVPVPTPPPPPVNGLTVKTLPSTRFICEPFGNMNGGDTKAGLRAELAYVNPQLGLSAGEKNSYSALRYFDGESQFVKSPTALFLSQINVPTRQFDQGFRLSDGSYLTDTANNRLIEWFALKMSSVLKLAAADQEGYYELATISDDGSVLFLGSGAQQEKWIDNDGAHSTRMKCASKALMLKRTSKIPMTYFYNQGPRTEIANVLVWKFRGQNAAVQGHRLCDVANRTEFWNPANSSPGPLWQELERDGYRVVSVDNFELPNSQLNPCATQNVNLITKAEFTPIMNNMTTLNVDFVQGANIRAQLFKVVNNQKMLVQMFDFSTQIRHKISLMVPNLELNAEYSVEILLIMPNSGTQVLNEVRFQIVRP
ncbi:MAG: hypothetical protein ACK5Y2_00560 [Bdellovibrionales bacterium]